MSGWRWRARRWGLTVASVDKAQQALQDRAICKVCGHAPAWHETEGSGHVKIAGRCKFPGECACRGYAPGRAPAAPGELRRGY